MTTPQPSTRDIDSAQRAVNAWVSEDELGACRPHLVNEIAQALAQREAEVRAEYAAFADEHGKPRKVLGTLPVTADGYVMGFTARIWVNDVGEVKAGLADMPGWTETEESDEAFWPFHECYSTRDAALAARKEGE
jgi:hypothetical protein